MEKEKILSHLLQQITDKEGEIRSTKNRMEVVGSLFDDTFNRFDEKIVGNLKNLIKYYFIDEQYGYQSLLTGIQGLIEKIKGPDDIEYLKNEEQATFDKKYGTKTSASMWQIELEENISVYRWKHAGTYNPSPVKSVVTMLDFLPNVLDYSQYTFIDVGSGMGRNLLLASEYPFKKIIGVEISNYLHEIAVNNITLYKNTAQKCRDVYSYCMDILDFDFSANEKSIFYFWDPFSEEIFEAFFLRLLESMRISDQKVFLVFLGKPYRALKSSKTFKHREVFHTQDKATERDSFLLFIYSN